MPDIGFYRSQRTSSRFQVAGPVPEYLPQRLNLDWVAERRACPVRFNAANLFRLYSGNFERLFDDFFLPLNTGRGVAHFGVAVIINCRSFDDGVNVIAIGKGIVQPLQQHRSCATAWNRALGRGINQAWEHEFSSDRAIGAVFENLPGAGFTVFGAAPARNAALASAGAELKLHNGISLRAKFDGEFAGHDHVYAGTGSVRYSW